MPDREYAISLLGTLGCVGLWYSFSIGLTFYNKWLFSSFRYPLSVTTMHMLTNFLCCWVIRSIYSLITGKRRVEVGLKVYLMSIVPTAAAAGIDIALSNFSMLFITISLYTMCKSTTIMFLLLFAFCFGLEKPKLSTALVIFSIALGTFFFTYGAVNFHLGGFIMVMTATTLAGLRWALTQLLLQKKSLGLHSPVDTLYHVTPTMALVLLPAALAIEGPDFFTSEMMFLGSTSTMCLTWSKICAGALIAFLMNYSEYLLLSRTSGLTLAIAGIIKEIATITLSVHLLGDHLSSINIVGMVISILGIAFYNVMKFRDNTKESENEGRIENGDGQQEYDLLVQEDIFEDNDVFDEMDSEL